jgi:hypothetical protein
MQRYTKPASPGKGRAGRSGFSMPGNIDVWQADFRSHRPVSSRTDIEASQLAPAEESLNLGVADSLLVL